MTTILTGKPSKFMIWLPGDSHHPGIWINLYSVIQIEDYEDAMSIKYTNGFSLSVRGDRVASLRSQLTELAGGGE